MVLYPFAFVGVRILGSELIKHFYNIHIIIITYILRRLHYIRLTTNESLITPGAKTFEGRINHKKFQKLFKSLRNSEFISSFELSNSD